MSSALVTADRAAGEQPVYPPSPPVPAKDLSTLQLVVGTLRSNVAIWPDDAFDNLVNQRTTLGLTGLLVSDPVWVRHVMVTNATNYRRPSTVRRVAVPVGGNGLSSQAKGFLLFFHQFVNGRLPTVGNAAAHVTALVLVSIGTVLGRPEQRGRSLPIAPSKRPLTLLPGDLEAFL